MKPKGIPRRLKGFKSGINGYSGVSSKITKITTARTQMVETVSFESKIKEVNVITESGVVVVTP